MDASADERHEVPRSRDLRPRRNASRRWLVAVVLVVGGIVLLVARGCGNGERDPYRGFGAWVDVFDYVPSVGGERVPVGPPDVDAMAAYGVRTLYLQAGFVSRSLPGGLVPGDLVGPLIRRAHARDMLVVGWYAPPLIDPSEDARRLVAIANDEFDGERFDAVAVDIEDRQVADIAERNRRLVELSRRVRGELRDVRIGAIVLSPLLLQDVNPRFWPAFPWREIAPYYDAWLPMAYWTDRLRSSGLREPRRYVTQTVARTRALIGDAGAAMHVIGGIGNRLTEAELATFAATLPEVRAIGGSIYDYRTLPTGGWGVVRDRMGD